MGSAGSSFVIVVVFGSGVGIDSGVDSGVGRFGGFRIGSGSSGGDSGGGSTSGRLFVVAVVVVAVVLGGRRLGSATISDIVPRDCRGYLLFIRGCQYKGADDDAYTEL